jgi:hypothetical protein
MIASMGLMRSGYFETAIAGNPQGETMKVSMGYLQFPASEFVCIFGFR